jgi:hypothetical protein
VSVIVHEQRLDGQQFQEETEALSVNAGGSLITLTNTVKAGQDLLLTNKISQKEQKAQIVYQGSAYLETSVVGIGFPQNVSDFWL